MKQTPNALYLSPKMKRRQTLHVSVAFTAWSLPTGKPASLIMLRVCVYQGTGIFIDSARLGSNLAHDSLTSGLCDTLSWVLEKSTLLNTF